MTEDATPSPAEAPDTEAPETRIATLEEENAALKDRLMRTLADLENLRKRSEREVRDAGQYAIAKFAGDMVTVADNLRRALDAAPEGEAADPALTTLSEGVDMTERELLRVLERHGVRKLEPKGERFDPNFHQAMFEVPNDGVPAGMVVEVVQSGFAIGERVLRAALVGVSKGGPKWQAQPEASADAAGGGDPADTPEPAAGPDDPAGGDHIDKTA